MAPPSRPSLLPRRKESNQRTRTGGPRGSSRFAPERGSRACRHGAIEEALSILLVLADRAEAGTPLPGEAVAALLDFLGTFADRCHHEKEEHVLFPALARAGFSLEHGPLAVMLHEHELARGLLRALSRALPDVEKSMEARARFVAAVRGYAELLQGHIAKENQVLFPAAERALDPAEDARIVEAYEKHERELGDAHERAHATLARLRESVTSG